MVPAAPCQLLLPGASYGSSCCRPAQGMSGSARGSSYCQLRLEWDACSSTGAWIAAQGKIRHLRTGQDSTGQNRSVDIVTVG